MPRGIPKDPNHTRNKKKDTAGDTAPKKRGRPPGAKNTAKAQTSVAIMKTVSRLPAEGAVDSQTRKNHIDIVRENVRILSGFDHRISDTLFALQDQVNLLLKLTAEEIGVVSDGDNSLVETTTESPQPSAAPLPAFVAAPPFPPHVTI